MLISSMEFLSRLQADGFPTFARDWLQVQSFVEDTGVSGIAGAPGEPIGSGITEAACKTVFTQRLKLSGMRWKTAGAQVILNLRVCLLSGIWQPTYRAVVDSYNDHLPRIYPHPTSSPATKPR